MSLHERLDVLRKIEQEKLNNNILYNKKYNLKYITGVSAFNIPYNGVQCDWHQVDMLKYKNFIEHPRDMIGAEDILGDYGLWDCSGWLKSKGIDKQSLCATPSRAIIDKLYHSILIKNEYPRGFDNIWDNYMFEEINKGELIKMLNILELSLSPRQLDWLNTWRENNAL